MNLPGDKDCLQKVRSLVEIAKIQAKTGPCGVSASAGMGRCAVGHGCQPPQALTAFHSSLRTKIDPLLHSKTLLPILPSITLDKPFSEHPGTDNYPRL